MTTPMQEVTVNQPHEAGFSTNFFLSHPLMGRQQFTFRGAFATDWVYVMEELKSFIKHMQDKGWKLEGETLVQASAPQPDPAAKIALEADNKQMAKELQTEYEAVPPAPDGKQWQTYQADIVKVLPQPDNRVTLEFWGAGRKYPDLKVVKWKLESANGLMKHVTSEPMDKAAEYKLACVVYYTHGKEFEPGKFYKDVAHVRRA
jgi:hypothetical protein